MAMCRVHYYTAYTYAIIGAAAITYPLSGQTPWVYLGLALFVVYAPMHSTIQQCLGCTAPAPHAHSTHTTNHTQSHTANHTATYTDTPSPPPPVGPLPCITPYCVLTVYLLCTYCVLTVYLLCTYCVPTVYLLCTYCVLTVYLLCTYCVLTVYFRHAAERVVALL